MEHWTVQYCVFVVEAYLKNGDLAGITQRVFHRHLNIPRHGRVPSQHHKTLGTELSGKYPHSKDMCVLRGIFPQHVISRGGDVPW
jgi:hypothetical protein